MPPLGGGGPRRNIVTWFGAENYNGWSLYQMVKKFENTVCLFVLMEYTNVTDRQTDRRTPHDDIVCD